MKPASVVRYPVPGVTLHRAAAGQRSQGDGEEQTPAPSHASPETTKVLMQASPKPPKALKEVRHEKEKVKVEERDEDKGTKPVPVPPRIQDQGHSYGNNKSVQDNLPEIMEIASKLTKVSIMSTPDSQLLNAAPKDLNTKKKILLHPKLVTPVAAGRGGSSRTAAAGARLKGKRDPRFVPYEPYKGCVKPIQPKKKKKKRIHCKRRSGDKAEVEGEGGTATLEGDEGSPALSQDAERRNAEKLSILVRDFERERSSWEERLSSLATDRKTLEEQMTSMKKDKTNLESQLKVQSQVNTELKRLLVASVGEEVQGRVQCLTEDKARMAGMIRRYSEKVDRDYEEKERIGIQCDVWRSKFLASSMLVDDLVGMRVGLGRRLEDAEEALRVLLAEHDLARQHTLNMYRMNKQLREAFDPLAVQSGGLPPLASADLVTLAVEGDVLAETVRNRLLGELGRSVGCSLSLDGLESSTPGQKIASQLVNQLDGLRGEGEAVSGGGGEGGSRGECSTVCPGRSALLHRFHPNTRYEHLTVNCCAHCNGEIKVV
ncbi:Golgin-45 [Chionoecetes opilio]|uniref:Golgin-45 n=1 Tax=Chionoecetes opilio TaxID=41210 RepID=A0A8J8WC08_CHIOP|nr:Golgin-45 [Chionoecetes opilio]